jgi:hypothetical protein
VGNLNETIEDSADDSLVERGRVGISPADVVAASYDVANGRGDRQSSHSAHPP